MTLNCINNSSSDFTINPKPARDSTLQMDINSVGKYRLGVDFSDTEKFKISKGSALGTNDYFIMNADGILRLPLQSAFFANSIVGLPNSTGDGTEVTIISTQVIFDQNGDYDNTTGIFTAPISGRYFFGGKASFSSASAAGATGCQYHLNPTAGVIQMLEFDPINMANNADGFQHHQFNGFINMDASDTVTFSLNVSGGSKIINVFGPGPNLTQWWGYLVA